MKRLVMIDNSFEYTYFPIDEVNYIQVGKMPPHDEVRDLTKQSEVRHWEMYGRENWQM